MGYRGHVLDRTDLKTGCLQRPDGGLPARTWALDEDIDLAHAVFHRPAGGGLRRHLRGVRRGLARSLEPDLTRGRPRDDIAGRVGNRDDRVVERAPDVGVPVSDVLPLLAAHLLGGLLTAPWRHILLWLPCEVIDPRYRLTVRTTSSRPSSCRPPSSSCPCGCARSSASAARAPGARDGGGCPGSCRSRPC